MASMARRARYPAGVVLVLVLALVAGAGEGPARAAGPYPNPVPLRIDGLIGNDSGTVVGVSPEEARGASYLRGSNVLRLPDGDLRHVPAGSSALVTVPLGDPGAEASVAESRAWLDRGTVPGDTSAERRMAERALLDLRLLTRPNGAHLAAPNRGWDYVWPRDASWAAVAFSATGHHEQSYKILRFLAEAQGDDGAWEARYDPGSGEPVLDGRPRQLDAVGWFAWAVWYWHETAPEDERGAARTLWPAVRAASDAAARSLGPNGLPPAGPDYWETTTWRPNIGTAAPLRTGLRATADLAADLGRPEAARRYADDAIRLDKAIEREFAPHGFPRTTDPGSGADAAVNFLAPPFAPPDPAVERAVARASSTLTAPNGGVLPGELWRQDPSVSWTPETAFFALSAAAGGDETGARDRLEWLENHRTGLGVFPEKVDGEGEPKAAAPLGWTGAVVLLALVSEDRTLPVPPVPEPSADERPRMPFAALGGVLIGACFLGAATRPRWRRPPG